MLCNVSRKTFSRVVKEFESRRLVTLGYKSLTVNILRDCVPSRRPAESEPATRRGRQGNSVTNHSGVTRARVLARKALMIEVVALRS